MYAVSRDAAHDIVRLTGALPTIPVLTPSRAIDSISPQFSRKIRAASLALSAWIVKLHARLVPLLASWK
ncbi:hypothetical protein CK489_18670 [Bradyrhizobium sp. UFLA03-84]|nr:hypothetical protein CK489_18670 [Bradyrhizobium sp. UFLA03-84]